MVTMTKRSERLGLGTVTTLLFLGLGQAACASLPSGGSSNTPQRTVVKEGSDAPEISRSAGQEGSVIVFFPRMVPRSETEGLREHAQAVQDHLVEAIKRAVPDRPVDVRPEPERVCPQAGCRSMTVGAVITRRQDVCAVIALVSASGKAGTRLVPYAGEMELKKEIAPFRDPPENYVLMKDYASCEGLVETMKAQDSAVEQAIKDVALAE